MPNLPSRQFTALQGKNWQITDLPGLKVEECEKLIALGLNTTKALLHNSNSMAQQTHLAQQLQLHVHHIQKWRALADMARIPTVGNTYCGLLLHAGVPSVKHLATLAPGRLHRQILKLQVSTMRRPDLCPDAALVTQWIQQAQRL
ncbi:DUF4332 domain-containing protein [Romeriopsis navalis]|uniref:DUF4332 domain-containing protein n=1 Tax=Romeriopsis navalis TaxID=2992132 RepID=UPI0021F88E1A|nr:DUF4332 domain-containing protein [Romeriopsis navalis]